MKYERPFRVRGVPLILRAAVAASALLTLTATSPPQPAHRTDATAVAPGADGRATLRVEMNAAALRSTDSSVMTIAVAPLGDDGKLPEGRLWVPGSDLSTHLRGGTAALHDWHSACGSQKRASDCVLTFEVELEHREHLRASVEITSRSRRRFFARGHGSFPQEARLELTQASTGP